MSTVAIICKTRGISTERVIQVLEVVENIDQLEGIEQKYLTQLKPPYNVRLIAQSNKGVPRSAETIAKISAGLRGNKCALGRVVSSETREKMRQKNTGRIQSAEERLKRSQSIRNSEAFRLSRVAARGRKHTEEHKRKISIANKGKKLSVEHKEKIRISWLRRKGLL